MLALWRNKLIFDDINNDAWYILHL